MSEEKPKPKAQVIQLTPAMAAFLNVTKPRNDKKQQQQNKQEE